MRIVPAFYDRTGSVAFPPLSIDWKATRYSWSDIGGPNKATLEAIGNEADLYRLFAWLLYRVELLDDTGDAVWWGYISSARLDVGALSIEYSIDAMANRVRVTYQTRDSYGNLTRAVTSDLDDTTSQGYYDIVKEAIVRGGDLSATAAAALAQSMLTSFGSFAPSLEVGGSNGEALAKMTLSCVGYWESLGYRFASVTQRDIGYTELNPYGPYGSDTTYFPGGFTNGATGTGRALLYDWPTYWYSLAQEFKVATTNGNQPMKITRVSPWLMRDGSNVPTGTVTLKIYTTSGTAPSALIGTMTARNASEITDGWFTFVPVEGSDIWVLPGVTYWAAIERSVNGTGVDNIGWNGLGPLATFSPYVTNHAKGKHSSGGAWQSENIASLSCLNLQVHVEHAESTLTFSTTSDKQKLAQSFEIGGSDVLQAGILKLRLRRMGTISADVNVMICPDLAGQPDVGAPLTEVAFNGNTVGDELEWVEISLASGAAISPSTTYWFVLDTGVLDTANFISVAASLNKGYAGGVTKVYNGSAWGTPSPDVECLFELLATTETSTQASRLVTSYGTLISSVTLDVASGLYSSPARDGENTARSEIEGLLEAGTATYNRMLAIVNRDRSVRIYEAPTATATAYLTRNGKLSDAAGRPMRMHLCPTGLWIQPRDIAPSGETFAPGGGATLYYVQSSEYDPERDIWRPRLRGQREVFDFGGIA